MSDNGNKVAKETERYTCLSIILSNSVTHKYL